MNAVGRGLLLPQKSLGAQVEDTDVGLILPVYRSCHGMYLGSNSPRTHGEPICHFTPIRHRGYLVEMKYAVLVTNVPATIALGWETGKS